MLVFMLGGLFLVSAFFPIHPVDVYGPPGPATPQVQPEWYLMWTYGFLKLVPPQAIIPLPGAAIGPEFIGGIIFGGLVFGILFAVPWLDRTNRSTRSYEYLEPVWQAPLRTALGVAFLAYLAALFIAAYYDSLGLTVAETWLITLAIPMVIGSAVFLWQKRAAMYHAEDFDPTGETTQVPDAANSPVD